MILPLSTDAAVGNLIGSYLANMRDNYVRQEEDWDHDVDFDGFFDISSPVIIYPMVSPGDSLSITVGILMIKIRYYNY